jgi:tRNA(Ile)-lysidine synthase
MPTVSSITAEEFAARMATLGPFEPGPLLAAAVSGGADSMALALLADTWARARDGSLLALVVDHGLREDSDAEAALTIQRLAARGIAARMLRLDGLNHGPALAERARAARYAALRAACTGHGILHLLLGHHAADQAETVLMRRDSNSGPAGLAAMPALAEQSGLRLLRPLLGVPPVRLRATLGEAGLAWVEDPSNHDQRALRARLRAGLNDPDGTGPAVAALCVGARAAGEARATHEAAIAGTLAGRAAIHPEGFALLSPGPVEPAALAALIQTIGGAAFPPPSASVAALAAAPQPATLGGVRVLWAGRLGDALLLVREAASMGPPVEARPGALWDGRFRLQAQASPPDGTTIGALGADAAGLRRWSPLPSAVLQTLPALRCANSLVAVPHLLYPDPATCIAVPVVFNPRRPVAGAPFLPDREPGMNMG